MKILEVTQPSEQALFEAIDAENDTGIRTEDLVKIIKTKDGPWAGPFTSEEFEQHLRQLAEAHGVTI
jgi:ATP-dependent DNA ligase